MPDFTGPAAVKMSLTEHAIEALEPPGKAWIAWDDELTGFENSDPVSVS